MVHAVYMEGATILHGTSCIYGGCYYTVWHILYIWRVLLYCVVSCIYEGCYYTVWCVLYIWRVLLYLWCVLYIWRVLLYCMVCPVYMEGATILCGVSCIYGGCYYTAWCVLYTMRGVIFTVHPDQSYPTWNIDPPMLPRLLW